MKTVLVTGAAGFIGSKLVDHFAACGWSVIGAGRRNPGGALEAASWRRYDLRERTFDGGLFEGVDAIVHAAVERSGTARDYETNADGTALLFEKARANGIERFVFLSSLAAHAEALSAYGKQKLAIERLVHAGGGLVVRPGLVLGSGGTFAAMCRYLLGHRYVPLFAGGRQPLQTVYVGDLVSAIRLALEEDVRGTYTAAEVDPVTYRRFYAALARALGADVRFVPMPFWAAEAAMSVASRLRMKLPIDRENILGLKAMRMDEAPRLAIAGLSYRTYTVNIDLALADARA